jgi:hypothetical protein
MPYPDRQNCWPYDEIEAPGLSLGVICAAIIGLAGVVGALAYCFL